jgi:hypothetical protein
MSDADKPVLDYLREQFGRLHTKMDRIIDDVGDLKARMTGVELELARLSMRVAETNARIDRIEVRPPSGMPGRAGLVRPLRRPDHAAGRAPDPPLDEAHPDTGRHRRVA